MSQVDYVIIQGWDTLFWLRSLQPGVRTSRFLPWLLQKNVEYRSQKVTLSLMGIKSLPFSEGLHEDKIIHWSHSGSQSFRLFATPWTAECQASLSFTISQSLLKLMSIESVTLSNYLILCHPILLLPSIFDSIRVFSNELALHIRWPKYWSFSFSISPSNEYSGLISFRIDWSDLLTVQGTLKSLLQHHSLKASILRHSAFLMVQLSHPYMTTGKTIALTIWTFVSKGMSLLFNMNSGFVIAFLPIAFLPRSKCLLISWLQSPAAVILEPMKRKSATVSTFFPSICHEVMEQDVVTLVF